VLTRNDLGIAYQAVQGAHAVAQFCVDHPNHEWNNGYLIFLEVDDLYELKKWEYKLKDRNGIEMSWFYEPDLSNEMTGIAVYGSGYVFRNLQVMSEKEVESE